MTAPDKNHFSSAPQILSSAHPNFALCKYWGKSNTRDNTPSVPSLSITLDSLSTDTTISQSEHDNAVLNGHSDERIITHIDRLRASYPLPPVAIHTQNNFPTAAGLASSASGFAALVTGLNHAFSWNLTREKLSELARQASASAARSIFGGFVGLKGPDYTAYQVAPAEHWDLSVVIAITSTAEKRISSMEGMQLSAKTSPYYRTWVESAEADYQQAERAVEARDFQSLAEVSERSCFKMHAVMQTTQPALLYWNAATVHAMHTVMDLRQSGTPVFFTIDAGPQLKAVCESSAAASVARSLQDVPGVIETRTVGLGEGARIIS